MLRITLWQRFPAANTHSSSESRDNSVQAKHMHGWRDSQQIRQLFFVPIHEIHLGHRGYTKGTFLGWTNACWAPHCRHQWHSSLEHWYSTSSSTSSWQMEIPRNQTCETLLKGWYSHSDYLNPSTENMPKASLLWITMKCSVRGWICRAPAASKGSPWPSVSQVLWGIYTDLQIQCVQVKLLSLSPILQSWYASGTKLLPPHNTSLESLHPPETQACK